MAQPKAVEEGVTATADIETDNAENSVEQVVEEETQDENKD